MAKKISNNKKFAWLVYVACQNDFMGNDDWIQEAHNVLARIKPISQRFGDNVVVVLHTYMEYTLRDIFLESGWKQKRIEKTHSLRNALPRIFTNMVMDIMTGRTSLMIFCR